MKSLKDRILESKQIRPSGVIKVKNNVRKEMNNHLVGDRYDLTHDNTVKSEDKYVDTNANAYIYDKAGNKYYVETSDTEHDSGYIVGGAHDYKVIIKNVNDTNIVLTGYSALFSNGHGVNIIPDIVNGYYLEDYLAKNENSITSGKDIATDFIVNGNVDAKSYNTIKKETKKLKEQEFANRYMKIDFDILWKIESGKIVRNNFYYSNEDYDLIHDKTIELGKKLLDEVFPIPISKLDGLCGTFIYNLAKDCGLNSTQTYNYGVYYDTKKNTFTYIHLLTKKDFTKKPVVLNIPVTISLGSFIKINPDKASPEVKELVTKMYDEFVKAEKHGHQQFLADRADAIYRGGQGMYSWNRNEYTKAEARKLAEHEYNQNIENHNPEKIIDYKTSSKQTVSFDLGIFNDCINKMKPNATVADKSPDTELNSIPSIDDNVVEDPTAAPTLSKATVNKAEAKMDAWHAGTRKQNIKSSSDSKLKMNYNICIKKGYTKEANELKQEATSRGLTFESICMSISDKLMLG